MKNKKIKIRLATSLDLQKLSELHLKCERNTYDNKIIPGVSFSNKEESDKYWVDRLKFSSSKFTFIAEDEKGEIVGFVTIGLKVTKRARMPDSKLIEIYGTYIEGQYISPSEKNKGIGTRLLKVAMEWVLSMDSWNKVFSFVLGSNTKAFEYSKNRLRGEPLNLAFKNKEHSMVCFQWKNPETLLEKIDNPNKYQLLSHAQNPTEKISSHVLKSKL